MNKTRSLFRLSLVATALLGSAYSFAAKVPAGTQLADVQEVRLANSEPETLDPQRMTGSPEGDITRQLFETLVITDTDGKIEPGVAKSWESSPDFKVWTFHLRNDAKWSNGEPVTAHDFLYAWRRLADPKTASHYADYLEIMKIDNATDVIHGKKPVEELGVKVIDDYTFQMTLNESVPFAPDLTAHYILSPTHRKTIETYGDKWVKPENMVSNGAYTLAEHVINEKIVVKRNPNYWNDKETVIDRGVFVVTEGAAAFARYRAGDLDLVGVPSVLYKKIKDEFASEMYRSPRLSSYFYGMNAKKPPFNDIRVRRALDLAVDRQIFAEKVMGRGEKPSWNFIPYNVTAGELVKPPVHASWTNEERYAEANKLLAEAGYSKDNPLKFELLYSKGESAKNMAIALESQFRTNLKGAVKMSLRDQEWKTYLEEHRKGEFEMASEGWGADYNEASTFANFFLSTSNFNRIGFKSKEYDDLVAAAYKVATNEERAKLYAQAEEVLDKEHPFIKLYQPIGVGVKKPYLEGFGLYDPSLNYRFKNMYITKTK